MKLQGVMGVESQVARLRVRVSVVALLDVAESMDLIEDTI